MYIVIFSLIEGWVIWGGVSIGFLIEQFSNYTDDYVKAHQSSSFFVKVVFLQILTEFKTFTEVLVKLAF